MKFTSEVKKATEPIYQKISKILPEIEWPTYAPYIHKINKLKKEMRDWQASVLNSLMEADYK